jgi:hypothetical protein
VSKATIENHLATADMALRQSGFLGPPVPLGEGGKPGKIHAAMAAVMLEVGGVAKGRRNEQQNYKFRGIADIYLACQPVMAKHGVHCVLHEIQSETYVERQTNAGKLMPHTRLHCIYRFYAEDGSWVQQAAMGEAMDTGDKASNKAMSAAQKYALVQAFCIPEEDPDIDTEHASPEASSEAPPRREPARPATAPQPPPSMAPDARWERAWGNAKTILDATMKGAPKMTPEEHEAVDAAAAARGWSAAGIDTLYQQRLGAPMGFAPHSLYEPLLWIFSNFDPREA